MSEPTMRTQRRVTASGKNGGFTLVELLVGLLISGIIMTGLYITFSNQQRHYRAQLDVTAMQQNIRASLNLLSSDIRMAGFEEWGVGQAEIVAARPDLLYFTVDLNEDGDVNDAGEHIAYDLYDPSITPTAYNASWTGGTLLGRSTGNATFGVSELPAAGSGHWEVNGHSPADEAIDNIERLEFFYLDEDGAPTTTATAIRTVVVSILARADKPDNSFTNNQTYTPASQLPAYGGTAGATYGSTPAAGWVVNDNFRRRMQIMRIECRNVGL